MNCNFILFWHCCNARKSIFWHCDLGAERGKQIELQTSPENLLLLKRLFIEIINNFRLEVNLQSKPIMILSKQHVFTFRDHPRREFPYHDSAQTDLILVCWYALNFHIAYTDTVQIVIDPFRNEVMKWYRLIKRKLKDKTDLK